MREKLTAWNGLGVFVLAFVTGLILCFPLLPLSHFPIDDASLLLAPYLQSPISFKSLVSLFTPGNHVDYYPLRDLTHLLDIRLMAKNQTEDLLPARIQQIFWWSLCLWATSTLIQLWIKNRITAAVLAFLFWCHPIQIEMLWWIAARKDLIAMAFGTLSLKCGIQNWAEPTPASGLRQIAWALGSALGKASYALTPATLIRRKQRLLFPGVVLAAVICGYLALQNIQYSHWNDMRAAYPWGQRFHLSMSALGRVSAGIFMPQVNAIDVENWGDWLIWNQKYFGVGVVVLALASGLSVFFLAQKKTSALFWVACGWLIYLPISGLIFPHRNFYSVRYYIPVFQVIFLGAVHSNSITINSWRERPMNAFFLALALATLCTTHFQILNHWSSNRSVILHSLEHSPESIALQTLMAIEESNEARLGRMTPDEKKMQETRLAWLSGHCPNYGSTDSCLSYWMNLELNPEAYSEIIHRLNPWNAARASVVYTLRASISRNQPLDADLLKTFLANYPTARVPRPELRWLRVIALGELQSQEEARASYVNYLNEALLQKSDLSSEAIYAKKRYHLF